jgi:hypothetical protein
MHPSTTSNTRNFAAKRSLVYVSTFVLLLTAGVFLRYLPWMGTAQLHTMIEIIATLLAMAVGILALVRFYSEKENVFLFLGTGFLGASLLDGYHALVSSPAFTQYFPSPPPHLIPWSGFASRLFFAVLLVLSWAFWRREAKMGPSARVPEYRVFFVVNTWTLVCFLFFAVLPLPAAYLPLPFFHRPQELIPLFFCLVALMGYLWKGRWKQDPFEHCLVLATVLFIVHLIYMSSSAQLYDSVYIGAHVLRVSAYACTLVGDIAAMYQLAQEQKRLLAERTEDLQREIAARKSAEEGLRAAHRALNAPRFSTSTTPSTPSR